MSDTLINKYRPQSFSDVIGHKSIVASIKEALSKKLSRSFLFIGGAGQGKTTLARIIAKEVGCINPTEINGASNNGVDDMRNILETLSYKPLKGTSKVIIIDECQKLTSAAWDSILKSVEEPANHVYWIFCSTDPNKIPKTIKTRVQQFDLKPISEDELFNLQAEVCEAEGWETPDDVLDLISTEALGSARQALSYLAACHTATSRKEASLMLSTAGELPAVIDLARLIANGGLTWGKAIPLIKSFKDESPESIRLNIVNYLAVVLQNCTDERKACLLLGNLQAFSKIYNQSEKMAPLLLSIGECVFNGE